jgi:superfamily I DNA/RNA helicase
MELSEQQQALVDADGDLWVEACPGAGKTRAMVARYQRRTAAEPRKGIALLSFTNAAVDEILARSGDQPECLRAPHFVGTFDSFINRFITRPLYVRDTGTTPRFVDTWQGEQASFAVKGAKGTFAFRWFSFSYNGQLQATLVDGRINGNYAAGMRKFAAANRATVDRQATRRSQALVRKGSLSSDASRAIAVGSLEDGQAKQRIGQLLAARFSEIIIDEAQDCGPEELAILHLLRDHGVKVVAVADLDQSIFEFRRAEIGTVSAFAAALGSPLRMDRNYRSSPAICALNNSLRFGDQRETACGENATCPHPVLLMGFRQLSDIAPHVDQLLGAYGVPRSETMFVSHVRDHAEQSAGARSTKEATSQSLVLSIARAHTVLRAGDATPAERHRAATAVEQMLKKAANTGDDDGLLEERWLRDTAYRLAVALNPAGMKSGDYAKKVRDYVQEIRWPAGVTRREDLHTFLRAPSDDKWHALADTQAPGTYTAGTIHSVKGKEFTSTIVVLPEKPPKDDGDRHAIDHWEGATQSELRRVLYVGASRAQQLLILAVHANHTERIAAQLKRDGVHYEVV